MRDDDAAIVYGVIVAQIRDGVAHGVVPGRPSGNDRNILAAIGTIAAQEVLRFLNPRFGAQHQHALENAFGAELLDGVRDDGLRPSIRNCLAFRDCPCAFPTRQQELPRTRCVRFPCASLLSSSSRNRPLRLRWCHRTLSYRGQARCRGCRTPSPWSWCA